MIDLFGLLVLVIIFGVIFWLISFIPMPAMFRTIANVIVAVILLLILINALTGGSIHNFKIGSTLYSSYFIT
jgi:hypothetical protein